MASLADLESARLRTEQELENNSFPRTRFYLLYSYFMLLPNHLTPLQYDEYVAPLLPAWLGTLQFQTLRELTIPCLQETLQRLENLVVRDLLLSRRRLVALANVRSTLARKWLWVGQPQMAVKERFGGENYSTEDELSAEREIDRATACLRKLPRGDQRTWLVGQIHQWEKQKTETSPTSLYILGVDRTEKGCELQGAGGVLLRLKMQRTSRRTNVSRLSISPSPPPGDPVHNALLNALLAALKIYGEQHPRHADWLMVPEEHLAMVEDSSLGAAAAVLLANGLRYHQDRGYTKFHQSVAITGEVDADGRILPVAEQGLIKKIERAFFSPLETIFIPAEQGHIAREQINRLREKFPHRHLQVVEADNVEDLLHDLRFGRRIRSSLAAWTARRVSMVGWVVAALVMFMFIIFGLFKAFPTLRPWMDRNPVYLAAVGYPLVSTYNKESEWIWAYNVETDQRWGIIPPYKDTPTLGEGENLNMNLADSDADGTTDVLVATPWDDKHDITKVVILSDRGRVLRKTTVSPLAFPEFGFEKPVLFQSLRVALVSWDKNSPANPVLALVRPDGNSLCVIIEYDPLLTQFRNILVKRGWWFSFLVVEQDGRQALWAGGREQEEGYAIFAIFRDHIPSGPWPPEDTTGITLYRFPIDPLNRRLRVPMQVEGFSTNHTNSIALGIRNNELREAPIGCNYRFSHDGKLLRIEYGDAYWRSRMIYYMNENIPFDQTREEFMNYMTQLQIWNGSSWHPIDPSFTLPDSAYMLPRY